MIVLCSESTIEIKALLLLLLSLPARRDVNKAGSLKAKAKSLKAKARNQG